MAESSAWRLREGKKKAKEGMKKADEIRVLDDGTGRCRNGRERRQNKRRRSSYVKKQLTLGNKRAIWSGAGKERGYGGDGEQRKRESVTVPKNFHHKRRLLQDGPALGMIYLEFLLNYI